MYEENLLPSRCTSDVNLDISEGYHYLVRISLYRTCFSLRNTHVSNWVQFLACHVANYITRAFPRWLSHMHQDGYPKGETPT